MSDPRICRTAPPDFNHCTLAEVEESRALWRKLAEGTISDMEQVRLTSLWGRRRAPVYPNVPRDAA